MNRSRRKFILLAILLLSIVVLSGCNPYTAEKLLFSVDPQYQQELEAWTPGTDLSSALRQEATDNGVTLSNNITVETVQEGAKWRIVDNEQDKTYVIVKGETNLNVNAASEYQGVSWIEPLSGPLRATVVFFHDSLLAPLKIPYAWGWAIILVALVIRLILLPLGLKQMRSMREAQAKMKILQPELDKLKKKYAKDKQRLQQEQMQLYQAHGITQAQMAGCLPTLLQMPILFAFYYALIGLAAQKRIDGAPFFFIPDISKPEYRTGLSWLTDGLSLEKLAQPEIWPYLVLPALLAITQYLTIKTGQMNQPQAGSDDNPAAGMMGQMTWLMTGMFVFFALQVPAGLSLYWVVGNVLALGQQYYVNQQKETWEQETAAKTAETKARIAANGSKKEESAPAEKKKKAGTKGAPAPAPAIRRKRRKRR